MVKSIAAKISLDFFEGVVISQSFNDRIQLHGVKKKDWIPWLYWTRDPGPADPPITVRFDWRKPEPTFQFHPAPLYNRLLPP